MNKAQPGHLAHSYPNLKQTDKVRQSLSKSMKVVQAIKRLKPPALDWRKK